MYAEQRIIALEVHSFFGHSNLNGISITNLWIKPDILRYS